MLGFVWGFLKYHHPIIATGKYNWDYELFRILPKLKNIANKQERDDLLHTLSYDLDVMSNLTFPPGHASDNVHRFL